PECTVTTGAVVAVQFPSLAAVLMRSHDSRVVHVCHGWRPFWFAGLLDQVREGVTRRTLPVTSITNFPTALAFGGGALVSLACLVHLHQDGLLAFRGFLPAKLGRPGIEEVGQVPTACVRQ